MLEVKTPESSATKTTTIPTPQVATHRIIYDAFFKLRVSPAGYVLASLREANENKRYLPRNESEGKEVHEFFAKLCELSTALDENRKKLFANVVEKKQEDGKHNASGNIFDLDKGPGDIQVNFYLATYRKQLLNKEGDKFVFLKLLQERAQLLIKMRLLISGHDSLAFKYHKNHELRDESVRSLFWSTVKSDIGGEKSIHDQDSVMDKIRDETSAITKLLHSMEVPEGDIITAQVLLMQDANDNFKKVEAKFQHAYQPQGLMKRHAQLDTLTKQIPRTGWQDLSALRQQHQQLVEYQKELQTLISGMETNLSKLASSQMLLRAYKRSEDTEPDSILKELFRANKINPEEDLILLNDPDDIVKLRGKLEEIRSQLSEKGMLDTQRSNCLYVVDLIKQCDKQLPLKRRIAEYKATYTEYAFRIEKLYAAMGNRENYLKMFPRMANQCEESAALSAIATSALCCEPLRHLIEANPLTYQMRDVTVAKIQAVNTAPNADSLDQLGLALDPDDLKRMQDYKQSDGQTVTSQRIAALSNTISQTEVQINTLASDHPIVRVDDQMREPLNDLSTLEQLYYLSGTPLSPAELNDLNTKAVELETTLKRLQAMLSLASDLRNSLDPKYTATQSQLTSPIDKQIEAKGTTQTPKTTPELLRAIRARLNSKLAECTQEDKKEQYQQKVDVEKQLQTLYRASIPSTILASYIAPFMVLTPTLVKDLSTLLLSWPRPTRIVLKARLNSLGIFLSKHQFRNFCEQDSKTPAAKAISACTTRVEACLEQLHPATTSDAQQTLLEKVTTYAAEILTWPNKKQFFTPQRSQLIDSQRREINKKALTKVERLAHDFSIERERHEQRLRRSEEVKVEQKEAAPEILASTESVSVSRVAEVIPAAASPTSPVTTPMPVTAHAIIDSPAVAVAEIPGEVKTLALKITLPTQKERTKLGVICKQHNLNNNLTSQRLSEIKAETEKQETICRDLLKKLKSAELKDAMHELEALSSRLGSGDALVESKQMPLPSTLNANQRKLLPQLLQLCYLMSKLATARETLRGLETQLYHGQETKMIGLIIRAGVYGETWLTELKTETETPLETPEIREARKRLANPEKEAKIQRLDDLREACLAQTHQSLIDIEKEKGADHATAKLFADVLKKHFIMATALFYDAAATVAHVKSFVGQNVSPLIEMTKVLLEKPALVRNRNNVEKVVTQLTQAINKLEELDIDGIRQIEFSLPPEPQPDPNKKGQTQKEDSRLAQLRKDTKAILQTKHELEGLKQQLTKLHVVVIRRRSPSPTRPVVAQVTQPLTQRQSQAQTGIQTEIATPPIAVAAPTPAEHTVKVHRRPTEKKATGFPKVIAVVPNGPGIKRQGRQPYRLVGVASQLGARTQVDVRSPAGIGQENVSPASLQGLTRAQNTLIDGDKHTRSSSVEYFLSYNARQLNSNHRRCKTSFWQPEKQTEGRVPEQTVIADKGDESFASSSPLGVAA